MSEDHNPNQGLQRTSPDYDRLWRVRWLLDALNRRFPRHFYPGQQLCVDEVLIAFKGSVHFKQYIPLKPHKWGIKAFALSDSQTGYILKVSLYSGKSMVPLQGLAHTIVTQLLTTASLDHRGHHLYMDSYYTSPGLLKNLLHQFGTPACGTVRTNKRDLPAEIMCKKPKDLGKERGSFLAKQKDDITAFVWRDKRLVYLLSTIHDDTTGSVQRTVKVDGQWYQQDICAPQAVCDCTSFMGGVDLTNQYCTYYGFQRKTRKWNIKVFFYFLEMCKFNAYRIYLSSQTHLTQGKKPSFLDFTLDVIQALLVDANPQQRQGRPSLHPLDSRLTSRCMPDEIGHKTWCHVCWMRVAKGLQEKRRQTKYGCLTCSKALCIPECFKVYHTVKKYF